MAKLKVSNPLDMGGNPPLPPTMEEVASEMYGSLELPTNRNPRPRDTKLVEIRPDVKQPRRIIPAMIRRGWTGDVNKIPNMIREWRAEAERVLGETIDMVRLLEKLGDGREADKDIPPIVEEYLALCALAASIKRDGLVHPIQITRNGVINTGERRYMAHWLLHTWLGGFDTIPAVTTENASVWSQAAENGNRRTLNAIEFSRQLALLIMDMYANDDGVKFDDITFFSHEREFYAQVANGNIWRIKKGMGQRVLEVTGLKSIAQVNQYRALLSIDNDLWDEADMNNYAEGRIREKVKPRDPEKVNSVYTSTIVEVSPKYDMPPINNQMVVFDQKMRGALRQFVYRNATQGFYAMTTGNHVFVGWSARSSGYEVITMFGGREESKVEYDLSRLINMMFTHAKDFDGWNVVKRDDFMAVIRPPIPRNVPFTPSPTPTPPSVNREVAFNNIVGDDEDDVPYMPEDEEKAEAMLALAKREAEEWKASQPKVDFAPPPDFNEVVFGNGSPEYVLAHAVKLMAELAGDEQTAHVAKMIMTITKQNIATWSGNWEDVVGRWHSIFSEAVADMVNGIFNRLDAEGAKK